MRRARLSFSVCLPASLLSFLSFYTHPLSFRFFSHINHHRLLDRVPCAVQQVPIGQSLHIPQCADANPKPPVCPSHPPVPFVNHKCFKVCGGSVSVPQISLFVFFFFFFGFHIQVILHDVCLSLSDLVLPFVLLSLTLVRGAGGNPRQSWAQVLDWAWVWLLALSLTICQHA